jgi:hypothetical protein
LGLDVNVLAHEQAAAGGLITQAQMEASIKKIKGNFTYLIKGNSEG